MFSYIGICDFPSGEQATKSASLFDRLCPPTMSDWKLMVGVMMSFKTMTGLPSKWASAWPKKEDVASIFGEHPRAFNTLHYADYDSVSLLSDWFEAVDWGGKNLHALQLDMVWPDPYMVRLFRQARPETQVVLQVNANALGQMNDQPTLVIQQLARYGESVDYALLDKSHGRGVGMDAEGLLPFLMAIAENLPSMGLAVAGGLGPETMHLVGPIVQEFPTVSIDAQGRLRPNGNAMDPIDWDMADKYLTEAVRIFS